jgi:hypothetical protein
MTGVLFSLDQLAKGQRLFVAGANFVVILLANGRDLFADDVRHQAFQFRHIREPVLLQVRKGDVQDVGG